MMSLTLEEIRMAVQGEWLTDPLGGMVRDISTDSRTIETGDLFVALEGEHHDGHDFVEASQEKGAIAAIVSKELNGFDDLNQDFGIIKVEETPKALCDIADHYRNIINARVIAVVGSGGKTTTKELIAHLLSIDYEVTASPKSYNNEIGMPLSLFQVNPEHDFVVLEIGTNQPGEIDYLSSIARPDIGVMTNIMETHLEGLGSVEGVKQENGDLLRHLTGSGFTAYNADNKHVVDLIENMGISGYSYGVYNEADLSAREITSSLDGVEFDVEGDIHVQFPVPGAWNVYNVLAAMLVARRVGIDLERCASSLTDFNSPSMRMDISRVNDITFVNDAYNANPRSVELVLDEIQHYEWNGRKLVVLGDMAELGAQSEELHRDIGKRIGNMSCVDHVYFIGDKMKYAAEVAAERTEDLRMSVHNQVDELIPSFVNQVQSGDLVLLKGSRVMELESLIEAMTSDQPTHQLQQQ